MSASCIGPCDLRRATCDSDALIRSGKFKTIYTELAPASTFWLAETYHQEYFRHNPGQGYCMFVVAPKVGKFRKTFAAKRRKSAED